MKSHPCPVRTHPTYMHTNTGQTHTMPWRRSNGMKSHNFYVRMHMHAQVGKMYHTT